MSGSPRTRGAACAAAEAEKEAATIVSPTGGYGSKPSLTHCPSFYAKNSDGRRAM